MRLKLTLHVNYTSVKTNLHLISIPLSLTFPPQGRKKNVLTTLLSYVLTNPNTVWEWSGNTRRYWEHPGEQRVAKR